MPLSALHNLHLIQISIHNNHDSDEVVRPDNEQINRVLNNGYGFGSPFRCSFEFAAVSDQAKQIT